MRPPYGYGRPSRLASVRIALDAVRDLLGGVFEESQVSIVALVHENLELHAGDLSGPALEARREQPDLRDRRAWLETKTRHIVVRRDDLPPARSGNEPVRRDLDFEIDIEGVGGVRPRVARRHVGAGTRQPALAGHQRDVARAEDPGQHAEQREIGIQHIAADEIDGGVEVARRGVRRCRTRRE